MIEIPVKDLKVQPFSLISDDWFLITAGTANKGYNTMTACWGQFGSLWGHGKGLPTFIVYIRPHRYTKEFIEREDFYTISFFDKSYKKALSYLGTHSGRAEDKIKETNITPIHQNNITYFAEAKLVLVCRKVYAAPIVENGFFDEQIKMNHYPEKDYHAMYIGEVVKVLVSTEQF